MVLLSDHLIQFPSYEIQRLSILAALNVVNIVLFSLVFFLDTSHISFLSYNLFCVFYAIFLNVFDFWLSLKSFHDFVSFVFVTKSNFIYNLYLCLINKNLQYFTYINKINHTLDTSQILFI